MHVRVLVAGLVMAAGLAACSDEPSEPGSLPPVTAPPSVASPSPDPTPTGINAPTPEGAGAFARYFYAQVELAYERKDPELVSRLSAPGCETCDAFVETLVDVRQMGHRYEGVEYEIRFAEAPGFEGDEARVTVIYDGPAVVRYDAGGAVIDTEPAVESFEEEVSLVRSGDSWLVQEVARP